MLSCLYRVNRLRKEAENRWVNRLTIEPKTFCGLKEIELKTRKIQQKNQQCVTIMQSRLANKKRLLATPTRKTTWGTVGGESYVWEKFRELYSTLYTGVKVSRC